MGLDKFDGAQIKRAKHDKEYVVIHRHTAQDRNISFEARGMLLYLLSKPDSWSIQVADLAQQCQKGRVYRILKELIEAGYIENRERKQLANGKFEWTPYILHERPITNIVPFPEKPDMEKPYLENADILVKTEQEKTEENISPQADTQSKKALTASKTSKPRKEDRIFNGIAFTAFDIDTRQEDYQHLIDSSKSGGRIGKISSALKKAFPDVTPEDIFTFFKHYKAKFPNADMPRDVDKYLEHFTSFRAQAPKAVIQYANNTSTLAQAELSEDERAAALATFKAGRLQKASGG